MFFNQPSERVMEVKLVPSAFQLITFKDVKAHSQSLNRALIVATRLSVLCVNIELEKSMRQMEIWSYYFELLVDELAYLKLNDDDLVPESMFYKIKESIHKSQQLTYERKVSEINDLVFHDYQAQRKVNF